MKKGMAKQNHDGASAVIVLELKEAIQ